MVFTGSVRESTCFSPTNTAAVLYVTGSMLCQSKGNLRVANTYYQYDRFDEYSTVVMAIRSHAIHVAVHNSIFKPRNDTLALVTLFDFPSSLLIRLHDAAFRTRA